MFNKILKSIRCYVFDMTSWLFFLPIFPIKLRPILLKSIGIDAAFDSFIRPGSQLHGRLIKIGSRVVLAQGCYFDATGGIILGDRVHVGPNVSFVSVNHSIQSSVFRRDPKDILVQPIVVGRGCWIGANSVILPGVQIGEGVVIAAGSVVTRNCAPNRLYAGVPAVSKKSLSVSL